jgi:hypothetical protein
LALVFSWVACSGRSTSAVGGLEFLERSAGAVGGVASWMAFSTLQALGWVACWLVQQTPNEQLEGWHSWNAQQEQSAGCHLGWHSHCQRLACLSFPFLVGFQSFKLLVFLFAPFFNESFVHVLFCSFFETVFSFGAFLVGSQSFTLLVCSFEPFFNESFVTFLLFFESVKRWFFSFFAIFIFFFGAFLVGILRGLKRMARGGWIIKWADLGGFDWFLAGKKSSRASLGCRWRWFEASHGG